MYFVCSESTQPIVPMDNFDPAMNIEYLVLSIVMILPRYNTYSICSDFPEYGVLSPGPYILSPLSVDRANR